jgi:hypothetical protein
MEKMTKKEWEFFNKYIKIDTYEFNWEQMEVVIEVAKKIQQLKP